MKRSAWHTLELWKISPHRKPMVLKGARQVGKTWLMKTFGERCYDDTAYFNFDEDVALSSIFQQNKNPERIIELLSLVAGRPILPEKTLLILDEIQECPEALNALKYFKEKANQYHIITGGSLLGTLPAKPKSYPVGMVNILHIQPLSFEEFLQAADAALYQYYHTIQKGQRIEEIFHNRLLDIYNQYLIVGGMPEAVNTWQEKKNPSSVSQIQQDLIEIYEHDFLKHHDSLNSGRILQVFRNVASQLGKSNEKFIYGAIKEGGRAKDFEEAVEWLVSAGLLNRVYQSSKPEHPLPVYDNLSAFKLFLMDTGLLKHMSGVSNRAIILEESYQFKGPLTENYVLQQLCSVFQVTPRYYMEKNSEIDFLIQNESDIIPVEVKGGEDKSAPSFKKFIAKYRPPYAVRFSKRNYRQDGDILNIPLYLAGKITELL